jgi:phospholipid/cholesterol/gamma-HCH transport system substrate-binding protein
MPVLKRHARELNLVRVAFVGVALLAVLVVAALRIDTIRTALRGERYVAEFSNAAGLREGADVRIAGLTVGEVTDVAIDRAHVDVTLSLGERLGDRTRAAVKTDNLLGTKFVQVTPAGRGVITRIPVSRTSVPYDVTDALDDVTATTGQIDVDQLAESFESVSEVLDATPTELRSAVDGVGRLSQTISSRNEELRQLFDHSKGVSALLADRNEQLTSIMTNGNRLFGEVDQNRRLIHDLLGNISAASAQLRGLAADNDRSLRPALDELSSVNAILKKNEDNLEYVLQNLGGYVRSLGEAVGGGPFFYCFIQNIAPSNILPVLPELLNQATTS